jgi:hypothetical protein
MRASGLIGAVALLWSGCVTAPAVVPGGGAEQASASAGGAILTVFATPWEGEPVDLNSYVTPVPVELVNNGPGEVRVSYADFALTDENGFRYAALNPFIPAAAAPGGASGALPTGDALTDGTALVATRGVPPPPAGRGVPGYRGPRIISRPRPAIRGYSPGVLAPRWRGYAVYPGYRPWFGAGISYWPSPFLYTPGYATFVWGWSPAYYPSPQPPTDVINYGLPEGVLQPGGHVDGFLYFQRAHGAAHRLALAWDAHDARAGAPLGVATVPLETLEQR